MSQNPGAAPEGEVGEEMTNRQAPFAKYGGDAPPDTAQEGPEAAEAERLSAELDALKAEHAAVHDKYVRLHAEFDNFRKRTAKEKLDLLNSASADTIKSILPVLDDMERAIAHNTAVNDIEAVKQGFVLIQQKFSNILQGQGLQPMQSKGQPFDAELQEAITQIPAPVPEMKGKVLDVLETGYLLNDKVLRYAKVVVGQ